jgi:orotidine-5'-phosphate decarboxylase
MSELVVALDFDEKSDAISFVKKSGEALTWLKVGSVLFTKAGPEIVSFLKENGKKVFLDLKFHDIPNTVAGAVRSAAFIGADMINVHASGGPEMMRAAVEALGETEPCKRPLIIAVTVLTSLDERALSEILNRGVSSKYSVADHVEHLAKLAKASGMDGVVSSAREIEKIKRVCGPKFITVVPGIRPSYERVRDDQKRTMTPGEAVALGADFIVVGRPVLNARDPVRAAIMIKEEMNGAEAKS